MTGIQAVERKEKDLPLRPGKVVRTEFEYIRHGTQALIANANFDVVTGQVVHPSKDDLNSRILEFIDYFNRTMAKPFKWTYKGKVLATSGLTQLVEESTKEQLNRSAPPHEQC